MRKKNPRSRRLLKLEEAINANIDLIAGFLQDQVQFCDQGVLKALEREGAGMRLAKACKEKERRLQSMQSRRCSTALGSRIPK
jgi:hypothetical protein